MNQILRFLLLLFLGLPGLVRASHIMGGQLTYENVGTNQYVVTLFLYGDCGNAGLPIANVSLRVRNGCSGTVAGQYPLVPQPGTMMSSPQSCIPQCYAPGVTYEAMQYRTAPITIAPGQWKLSTETCCRPTTANLVGTDNYYFEATLNNQVLVNGQPVTVQSSSPQLSVQDLPAPFVPAWQFTTIGFNATDPDNTAANPDTDSLVYSLVNPFTECNVPVPYQSYPLLVGCFPTPTNPPCYTLPPPNIPANYTPTLPVYVPYNITGNCPIRIGTTMQFSQAGGQFTFQPALYINTPPSAGDNKHTIVAQVEDYRRLPGSNHRYLVGAVRREFMVTVVNTTNRVPNLPVLDYISPGAQASFRQTTDSTELTVYTGQYTQVHLRFTDPDSTDHLNVSYTGPGDVTNNLLLGGDLGTYQLLNNGSTSPVAMFTFQPANSLAGRVVRVPFRILDDKCPQRGLQTRILIIRFERGNLLRLRTAAGDTVTTATVCQGNTIALDGLVGRPDSVLDIASGQLIPQQYRYEWSATGTPLTSGLTAVQRSSRSISVQPTQPTRYFLRVTSLVGFGAAASSDTTSILVNLAAQPATPTISRTNNTLVSSASSDNQWMLNNVEIAGATAQTYTPTALGSYTVVVRVGAGPASASCSSAPSAAVAVTALGTRGALAGTTVQVLPNPTPDGHLTVRLTGYRQATTLTLLDALGRVVRTASIAAPNAAGTSQALDLSQLPSGVYVLRVSTPGGVDVRRVVRQ